MIEYVIILGSSMPNYRFYFMMAKKQIEKSKGIEFVRESKICTGIGKETKHNMIFANKALLIKTNLSPLNLLYELRAIEIKLGRLRPYKNSLRTIDIDIAYSKTIKFLNLFLQIPHAKLLERKFFLNPLNEIING